MDLKLLNTVHDLAERMDVLHLATGEQLKYGKKGEEKTMHLMMVGVDSPTAKKAQHKLMNKRIQKQSRMGGRNTVTSELMELMAVERIASCVVGGAVFLDGKEIEMTPTTAMELFQGYPWVYEQADAFVGDRSNFLQS